MDAFALERPVGEVLTDAGFTLREGLTLDEALEELRGREPGVRTQRQVIYFYVVDDAGRLVGVLPARELILAPEGGQRRVGEVMVREMVMLLARETLGDALELFAMHRLLAIPVVDEERKFLGIVEVSLYTDEVFDLAKNKQLNEVFQLVGLHLEERKAGGRSVCLGFRMRMPWLLSNITGGLVCAALGAFFESTVQKVVLVALFIPLILTLAESVAVQSMTLAIEQAMSGRKPGGGGMMRQELMTAGLLGLCSGVLVGVVSLFWRGPLAATLTIGGAVAGVMVLAAMLGRAVPQVVHQVRMNPRIASGPITLAVVDVVAITVYLSAASVVLG